MAEDMIELTGLGDLVGRYSTLLVDVWGVLHDGSVAFPGAGEALTRARRAGLRVILITNSASGVERIADRLGELGVRADAYDHIVTSGDLSRRHLLAQGQGSEWASIIVVRQGNGPSWLSTLPHPVVHRIDQAGLILVTSIPYRTEDELQASDLDSMLEVGCASGLTMVCADPDETYPESGVVRLGPGWVARLYREAGGRVIEFGKPHPPIYEEALRLAGGPQPQDVLVIGDNLKTDIVGGARQGFSSMLVLEGGVHGCADRDSLAVLAAQVGARPTYVATRLAW